MGNKLLISKYIVLAMTCWALAACTSSPDCFREDVFCAALVTDTLGIADHGINQDAWEGLQEASKNGLADRVEYITSVDARDYAKNLTYFTDRGFDVIFTSGIALENATLQSADLEPAATFVGFNQTFAGSYPNLISVTFPEDQMGFAAGVSAAQLTQTGIVAAVCETSGIDAMWRYCEGFRAGVKFATNEIISMVVYRENGDREKLFIDEAWGYETATDLIRRGADVLFAAGGATGQGALKAASEFGVYAIGAERNQAAALGESGSGVVTSFYGQTQFEVQEVMREVQQGNIQNFRIGKIQFTALNPTFSPEFSLQMEVLLAALAKGELKPTVTDPR